MRVTWLYREAGKHPLADSRNRPVAPRLLTLQASERVLLLSGSLSSARHPAHSSAAEGSDQGLPSLHYEARIKWGRGGRG